MKRINIKNIYYKEIYKIYNKCILLKNNEIFPNNTVETNYIVLPTWYWLVFHMTTYISRLLFVAENIFIINYTNTA